MLRQIKGNEMNNLAFIVRIFHFCAEKQSAVKPRDTIGGKEEPALVLIVVNWGNTQRSLTPPKYLFIFRVACVAAVSFPFPNAREREEKEAQNKHLGEGVRRQAETPHPIPVLTHTLPTSPQFFGSPQACSFARSLFVRLFDPRAAWKRKGIGCYAGYISSWYQSIFVSFIF